MRWLTFDIQHEPGFRFNLMDLSLICALAAASVAWFALAPEQQLYLLPLYVGGSFFLFCNVFRIGNRLEPYWYLTFAGFAIFGFSQPEFPWLPLLVVCEAVKWFLIAYRIRTGPYVGAFRPQLARFTRCAVPPAATGSR